MMLFGAAMSAAAMAAINQAISRVMSTVLQPATSLVAKAALDPIWRGDDADQFANKVTKQLIAALTSVTGYGNATVSGLQKAMDFISNADKQATSAVGELGQVFSQIF